MRVVIPVLDRFATQPLGVVEEGIEIRLGPASPTGEIAPDFVVKHPAVWRAIGRGGMSSLGRTYEDGWWTTSDLDGVISFFVSLLSVLPSTPNVDPITRRMRPQRDAWTGLGFDDPAVLGHIFDKTMFHGTGRFLQPETDLYLASLARFSQICEELELTSDSHLCEIGTGWGAFALYAARTRGCRVLSVTTSPVEANFATKRLTNAGLADRVEVRLGGPTSVTGTFDAVVSIDPEQRRIGSHPSLPVTFDRLLSPTGIGLLQTHVVESDSIGRAFSSGPYRETLAAISASTESLRTAVVSKTELIDDDDRTLEARIANLLASESDLERAGFPSAVFRSRMFSLVRDRVLVGRFGIRAMQLTFANRSRSIS